MDQYETWHAGIGLGPGHILLDGNPVPLPKWGGAPQFSAHICCGQMAGWIKMPLGREVGLSPGDIVLDGDPAPIPPKAGGAPKFSAHVYCGQTAGWMKMPLNKEVDLIPGHIVLDGDPAPPPRKGHSLPTLFGPCLLWPRSPISLISATAELL